MQLLNPGKKLTAESGKFPTAWTVAAVFILIAALTGPARGAATSVETVTYSPQVFNFQVTPQGGPSGTNNITFFISRKEEDRGVFNKCRKIKQLVIGHDPDRIYGIQHPGDYLVGRKELDPPLCNFTNVQVTGSPFLEEDINSICYETPTRSMPGSQVPTGAPTFMAGRSSVLGKELVVAFHQKSTLDKAVPDKKIYLQANIQCVESIDTGAVGPNWGTGETRQAGGATGTGTGTATGTTPAPTAGSAFGGRQFTPVDPRTPPRVPSSGGSTQPEVVPRDPRTVPRVPVGSGSPLPGSTPRDPGKRPEAAGRTAPAPASPSCSMDGTWFESRTSYWKFSPINTGFAFPGTPPSPVWKYDVQSIIDSRIPQIDIPIPTLGSPCTNPTAVISGNTLRWFCSSEGRMSYFEGTVDSSCNQVNGRTYDTNRRDDPVTLTRIKDDRFRVPNPNP